MCCPECAELLECLAFSLAVYGLSATAPVHDAQVEHPDPEPIARTPVKQPPHLSHADALRVITPPPPERSDERFEVSSLDPACSINPYRLKRTGADQLIDLRPAQAQRRSHLTDPVQQPHHRLIANLSDLIMPPARLPEHRPVAVPRPVFVPRRVPVSHASGRRQRAAAVPGGHVVLVAGLDGFPGVAGRVGCRKTERLSQPGFPVSAVVGQRLAGPLAGDQHAPPGVAEVFAAVRLALARAQAAGPAWRSWAGCRSAASSRTSASTAPTAAPQRAGRRAPAGRRCRAGGSRPPAWSGTWSGSRCTGWLPWTRPARPGRRTGPEPGHVQRLVLAPMASSASSQVGSTSPVSGSTYPAVGLVPDRQLVAVEADRRRRAATTPGGRWRRSPRAARRGRRCRAARCGHAGRAAAAARWRRSTARRSRRSGAGSG